MKKIAAIFSFLTFLSGCATAGIDVVPNDMAALSLLRKAAPNKVWTVYSGFAIDINSDGTPDYVFLSQDLKSATVGLVMGKTGDVQLQTVAIGDPSQNSICESPATIWPESLKNDPPVDAIGEVPGFVKSDLGVSFGLGGGECDAFHFFMDARNNKLTWWRL